MSSTPFASKTYIGFVVCLTLFTDMFLYGVVVPVLPFALVDRAGQTQDSVQFWNSILLASFASTMLPASVLIGWLGDRLESRRWSFIAGQTVLGGATILFAVGRTVPMLIVARALQGIGSALAFSVGYALLFDAVGKAQIGQAVGYTGMATSLGLFTGPVIGGILYDYAGYVWVFVPATILVGLEIIMRLLVVEPPRVYSASTARERDRLLPSEGPQNESIHTIPNGPGSEPIHANASDFAMDKSSTSMPIVTLLRNPRFFVAIASLVIINGINASFESVLPIFVSRLFGFGSTQSALMFLPMTVPFFASPVVGIIIDRTGTKWPSVTGFALGSVSFILLRLIDRDDRTHLVLMVLLLTLVGIAIAMAYTAVVTEVSHAVEGLEVSKPGVFGPRGALSLAFGLQNAALGAGAFVGPLVASATMQASGWSTLTLTMGALASVSSITAVLFTGGSLSKRS